MATTCLLLSVLVVWGIAWSQATEDWCTSDGTAHNQFLLDRLDRKGDDAVAVVFKKTPKTGSRFQKKALHKTLCGTRTVPTNINRFLSVGERTRISRVAEQARRSVSTTRNSVLYASPKHFVMGGVRNPCDMLVSAWAFAKVVGHNPLPGVQDDGQRLDSEAGVQSFEEWVRFAPGAITVRLAAAYAQAEPGLGGYVASHAGTSMYNKPTPGRLLTASKQLADLNITDVLDCVVHTETMVVDLKVCLARAEQRGVVVNWGAFDEEVMEMQNRHIDEERHLNLRGSTREATTNATEMFHEMPHATCETYFADKNLRDFVMEKEAAAFKFAGYSTCCGGPDPQ